MTIWAVSSIANRKGGGIGLCHDRCQPSKIYRIVGLYYYDFLVNEGIGLILVIQTFNPSTFSVLYNKDVYPTSSIV